VATARLAHAPRPLTLWAIAAAGAAAIAISVAFALSSDHLSEPGVHAALLNWITLTYVSAGLVAWWRRPESRFGQLMVTAGFAIFLSSLSSANVAVPYTIGVAFDLLPAVLFLHVFLAYPSGRLERRAERALVGAGYVTAFGLQLVGMALGGFGPDNLLEVTSEPDTAYTLLRGQLVATYDVGLSLPVPMLAGFTAVAVLAGVAAAILPARRASRLNVLDALHYE
jgi:hypothetical protein